MKKISLTEKTPAELTKMIGEKREELRTLRFSSAGSRPKDAAAPYKTRKEVARLMHALHMRKIA
jgi:ribosomal protein L29